MILKNMLDLKFLSYLLEMVHVVLICSLMVFISACYSSDNIHLSRLIQDPGNDTICGELDKPDWSIDILQNLTMDAWPLDCLNLHYNSSLNELISYSSADIFDASSKGYVGFVQYYAETVPVELNFFKDGQTPLHLAVKNGRLNVVEYITSKLTTANLNTRNYEFNTPLMYAALYGRFNITKYLLEEAKVDSSYDETDRSSVLYLAAQGGNLMLLKYLVEKKNYVVKNKDPELLLSAASGGNVDLIKYLIYKKGLSKFEIDRRGNTGLHEAAYKGRWKMVQFFTKTLNYPTNVQNFEGATPAHSAAEGGDLRVLCYVIEGRKTYLYARNGYGDYLLHIAAHYGHLGVVKYLVDVMCMSVELKDYNLRTPLHRAVYENQLDVVKYLADKGAYSNWRDKDGRNLLHQAVFKGNVTMMKYLINDMNMVDRIDDVELIFHRTPALEAAYYGRLTILKFLVDNKNARTWVVDRQGKNLLHTAAEEGDFEMVKYLIEEKNLDVKATTHDGLTAYDLALHNAQNKKELLKYLYLRMNPDPGVLN